MARPEYSSRRTSGAVSAGNPLKSWIEGKKERKRKLEEEASRLIIDETAGAEAGIIRTLELVDFDHSGLPASVLGKKSDPAQKYCDLELYTKYLIQKLKNNTHVVKVDVRKIDEQLARLALLFQQAVEQGDAEAANAAKTALATGIDKIRFKLPENQPEFLKAFIDLNAKYLSEWVVLVGLSQTIDKERKDYETRKKYVENDIEEAKQELVDLYDQLKDNPEYREAIDHISNFDGADERLKWTPFQRKVHQSMVDSQMRKVTADLNRMLLSQQENRLAIRSNEKEVLYSKLITVPSFEDPDLMNKYRESVDELFEQMARTDVELDEALMAFDDIAGRIKQFEHTPGAIRAKEIAAERANELLSELRNKQEKELNGAGAGGMQLRDFGLYSEKEMEELKDAVKQAEEELQVEKQTLNESARQLLYED